MLPLLSTAAWAAPLPPLPLEVQEVRLDNGIRVGAVHVPGSRVLAVQVRVAAGAAEEGPGQAGFAHLVEHVGFGGSTHAPAGAYDRWLAEVGADNNAWTEHDGTSYTVVAPPEALGLVLFLESDRLGWLSGGLTESEFDNQRDVVAAEAAGDRAAPHGRDLSALNAAVFPQGHPYHRPVIGDASHVAAATPEAVLAFHGRSHRPERVSVAIASGLDPDAVLAEARRWLGGVPPREGVEPRPPAAPPEPAGPSLWSWRDAVRQDAVYLAWPTVPRGHADEPALDLLARALGDALAADRGLERRGLQSVEAWTLNGRHGGLFVVEARVGEGSAADALASLERAVRRARLPARRLPELRVRWHADAVRAAQGAEARAHLVAACLGRGLPADCAAADLARYAEVSAADLARVRAARLTPARRTALLVVDPARRVPEGATPVVLP